MFTNLSQAFYGGFSSATHLHLVEEEDLPSLLSRNHSKLFEDSENMHNCDFDYPFSSNAGNHFTQNFEVAKAQSTPFAGFETELTNIDFFLSTSYQAPQYCYETDDLDYLVS